jgi:glucose/arabinose dehydrogenase
MSARRILAAVVLAIAIGAGAVSQATGDQLGPSPTGLVLSQIGTFEKPTYVAQAPGEPRIVYVVEQKGIIVATRAGEVINDRFLDLRDRVHIAPHETPSVEAGMYSVAFDPNYATNGWFYVMYTGPGGANYIDRFKRADTPGPLVAADPSSRRTILKISHPYADSHNGGQLQFGPDGMLWASSGDGGCCGDGYDQARSLGTLLGKLLRINPDAPKNERLNVPGNPLLGKPGPNAIYSWGLRNPWRFSFDRLTGHLVIADVGDNYAPARAEVDYLSPAAAAGANFGWPEYQGFHLNDPGRPGPNPPTFPVLAYKHKAGRCAIAGGYVVRDPRLPQLYGRYLWSDYCGGRVHSFTPPELVDGFPPSGFRATDDRDEGLYVSSPTSFGEGLGGQIYVASQAGPVYRLDPAHP